MSSGEEDDNFSISEDLTNSSELNLDWIEELLEDNAC